MFHWNIFESRYFTIVAIPEQCYINILYNVTLHFAIYLQFCICVNWQNMWEHAVFAPSRPQMHTLNGCAREFRTRRPSTGVARVRERKPRVRHTSRLLARRKALFTRARTRGLGHDTWLGTSSTGYAA